MQYNRFYNLPDETKFGILKQCVIADIPTIQQCLLDMEITEEMEDDMVGMNDVHRKEYIQLYVDALEEDLDANWIYHITGKLKSRLVHCTYTVS